MTDLLNPPRLEGVNVVSATSQRIQKTTNRFMYCLHVRTLLTFAAPSWFPSTCFPYQSFPDTGILILRKRKPWLNQNQSCPSCPSLLRHPGSQRPWTPPPLDRFQGPRSGGVALGLGGLDTESTGVYILGCRGVPVLT